jgi:hypothetical protein
MTVTQGLLNIEYLKLNIYGIQISKDGRQMTEAGRPGCSEAGRLGS